MTTSLMLLVISSVMIGFGIVSERRQWQRLAAIGLGLMFLALAVTNLPPGKSVGYMMLHEL